MDMQMGLSILYGAFMGLITVFVGWAKKQEPGKFDWKGILLRIPIGIVVGGIAGYKGIPFDEAYQWAAGVGIIMVLDNILKLIWRRFKLAEKLKLKKEEKEKIEG